MTLVQILFCEHPEMTLSFKRMFHWDDIHSRPLFKIPNSTEVVWESFEKEGKLQETNPTLQIALEMCLSLK